MISITNCNVIKTFTLSGISFILQLIKQECLCYHLLVEGEGGDGVDHIEVPPKSCRAGFFGRGDSPLPAPEVRGYTERGNEKYTVIKRR